DLGHPGRVGTARRAGGLGDVAEILRADVRRQDDEGAGRAVMRVAEAVHRAARRKHALARLQVAHFAIDRIAQRALEHIGDLLVVAVAVGRWDPRARWYRQLEDAETGAAHGAVDQVADLEAADFDGRLFLRLHALPLPVTSERTTRAPG